MSSTSLETGIRLFAPPCPMLPHFKNLLVKGSYPPTAPLHLCLSYLDAGLRPQCHNSNTQLRQRSALLLSPSRDAFTSSLEGYNEDWFVENSTEDSVARLLSRVKILYLPSLEHWLSILSLLRPVDSPTADNTNQNDNPTILSELPSIIVLHEPSQCFQTESNSNTAMTLSQYLYLVTLAFDTAAYLNNCNHETDHVPVVLFDSGLGSLRLPILKPVLSLVQTDDEPVDTLVEKYFETCISVEDMSCASSQLEEGVTGTPEPTPFKCTVIQSLVNGDKVILTWEWSESRLYDDNSGRWRTSSLFK